MKIRLDYVSNSSSSSFMIIGDSFPIDNLKEYVHRLGFVAKKDYEDDYYFYGRFIEEKFPGIVMRNGLGDSYSDEDICIGLDYASMKPDETKKEFEARVAGMISEITGKPVEEIKVKQMVDCGYDG